MNMIFEMLLSVLAPLTSLWMPADGDMTVIREFDCPGSAVGKCCGSDVWDFSEYAGGSEYRVSYRVLSDTVAYEFFPEFRMDYAVADSCLRIKGVETRDTHTVLGEPQAVFPTEGAGESRIREYRSRWQSEYAVGEGVLTRAMPECGTLILPGGDTIAPALMFVMRSEVDYTPADALWRTGDAQGESKRVTRSEIRWYSPELRYPVARIWVSGDTARLAVCDRASQPAPEDTEIPRSPDGGSYLSDYLNEMRNPGRGGNALGDADVAVSESDGYVDVEIAFGGGEGVLSYVFTDMAGRVWSSGSNLRYSAVRPVSLRINRRGLQPGEYLLHLDTGGEPRNEKIILH